jgi:hypothetical protein
MSPRPYQLQVIKKLASGACSYAALQQGLGKTFVAIKVAEEINARRVLVVCPMSVKSVWHREIHRATRTRQWVTIPEKPESFDSGNRKFRNWVIVNYDKLSRTGEYLTALLSQEWDLVICDEAHFLKSPVSTRSRTVFYYILPKTKRMIMLSGTPCPNHLGEAYGFLKHMHPAAITKRNGAVMTQYEYENAFCRIENVRLGAKTVRVIKGSKNQALWKERVGEFMEVLDKATCLPELPPIQWDTLPVRPSREAFKELNKYSHIIPPDLPEDQLLAFLRNGDEHLSRMLALLGIAKARAVIEWVTDFLFENDRKIVLWFMNHAVGDALMSGLSDFNPAMIDGRKSSKERDDAVEKFLTDPTCRVWVGQIQACGTGLTLLTDTVKPSDVVFVQSSHCPGDNAQAAARVHRIGQNNAVIVRVAVADGIALDERVQSIIATKSAELQEIF